MIRGRELARFLLKTIPMKDLFQQRSAVNIVDTILARIHEAVEQGVVSASDGTLLTGEWSAFKALFGECKAPLGWLFGPRMAAGPGCTEQLWDTLTSHSFPHSVRLGMHVPFVSKTYLNRTQAPFAIARLLDPVLDLKDLSYDDMHVRTKAQSHLVPMSMARSTGLLGMPPGTPASSEGEDKGNYRACNCLTFRECLNTANPQFYCMIGPDGLCTVDSDCYPT